MIGCPLLVSSERGLKIFNHKGIDLTKYAGAQIFPAHFISMAILSSGRSVVHDRVVKEVIEGRQVIDDSENRSKGYLE